MAMPVDRPLICPILIGREPQFAGLRQCLAAARQGTGQVVLVSGEAGIGKSRLVAELVGEARQQDVLVLTGQCFEGDQALPYAPILDLLRSWVTGQPPDTIRQRLGPAAAHLVTILPELASWLPGLTPGPALPPQQEQRRLAQTLIDVLIGASREQPLLIVIEDIHWSDDLSLDLLRRLARQTTRSASLLLLTYRPADMTGHLAGLLTALDRERQAAEVHLAPLRRDEVAAMLHALLPAGEAVRDDTVDALFSLTEGNPFFVEEMLRSLRSAGIALAALPADAASIAAHSIPRSIEALVRQRVATVSEAAGDLVRLAAVAGRRFDLPLLAALTGREEEPLLPLLKELVAVQLVVEETGERLAFRHALIRQAIYSGLLTRERAALHRQIAETLEALTAAVPESRLADLSYHYFEAGLWPQALTYAERAGAQAQALHAPRAAVRQWTRALTAAAHIDQTPRLNIYRQRAQAYALLGDFAAARADAEQGLALARASGDRVAEWQILLDLGLLWAERDYDCTGDYYEQALQIARGQADPAMLAHSLNRTGNWHVNRDQPDAAIRYHAEALAAFERQGDQAGLAETLDLLGVARYNAGELPGAVAAYERAVALLRELDDRPGLVTGLGMLTMRAGNYHLDTIPSAAHDERVRAVQAGEEALTLARAMDWRAGEAFVNCMFGLALGSWGEYGRALAAAAAARQIADEIEHHQWQTFAQVLLGLIHLDLQALPVARAALEEAVRLAGTINSRLWLHLASGSLASTCLAQGELARATAVLSAVPAPATPPRTLGQHLIARAHIELALAQDEPARALRLADDLLTALAVGSHPASAPPSPYLAWLRAEALAALNQRQAAIRTLAALESVSPPPPLHWRVQVSLGRLYQASRQRHQAVQLFASARATIEALAMTIPDASLRATFCQQALASLPQPRPLTALQATREAYDGLTAREREVAALIAEGKTNRQIAASLSASEPTIATHVRHILRKLDLTSRAQVAVWARDRGLAWPQPMLHIQPDGRGRLNR